MFEILFKALGAIELVLIIIGLCGNFFVFLVSKSLQKQHNTFVFVMFMSLSDMVTPLWWNLSHFVDPFFNVDSQNSNLYYCKFLNFAQFTSLQMSAWYLVIMTFDRLIIPTTFLSRIDFF